MHKLPTKDFTTIAPLSAGDLTALMDRADHYAALLKEGMDFPRPLTNKVVLNLFFENSTRTRTSFEMAALRLGAKVINWNAETSSMAKGESFLDTVRTLNAMGPDAIVIRHSEYAAPDYIAARVACPVINAGDSWRAHPSQALLDAVTIRQYFGKIDGLTVAIVGDISHSRVASSDSFLLTKMGATVRLIAPEQLMPQKPFVEGMSCFNSLKEGLPGADIVISIRPQKERMESAMIEDERYFRDFGMTHETLDWAGPKAVLLDPGPFLRGLMIDDDLADDNERFLYNRQVANGVPARMAILETLIG